MFPQTLNSPRSTKQRRAMQVLMGLVELHLQTGKPIGSQTLKDGGFDHMSSATLRNYFAHLEIEGYLRQAHISGGRLPTDAALRHYANEVLQEQQSSASGDHQPACKPLAEKDAELVTWIESIGAELARTTHCAIALLLPRFTQDYAIRIQLVHLNAGRILAIICTQHGLVHTISLQVKNGLTQKLIDLAHKYCNERLNANQSDLNMTMLEERFCSQLHSEIMIRYFIENSAAAQRDLSMSGLSEILHHPEGGNAAVFAEFVGLFENRSGLQSVLNALQDRQGIHFWIGAGLEPHFPGARHCAVAGKAYQLHRTNVGALALIGPSRMPYRQVFDQLAKACEIVSSQLTKSVHKFNIEMKPGSKGNLLDLPPFHPSGKALLQLLAPEDLSQKTS